MKLRTLLVLVAVLVFPTISFAQSNVPQYTDFLNASPGLIEKTDLIEALTPPRGYSFKPMAVGAPILFDINSSELTPPSRRFVVEALAPALSSAELASYEFLIEGHTDDTGPMTHNEDLSRRRAEAVRTLLTSHGVPTSRLRAKGLGEASPREPNGTEMGRSKNRRVEVVNMGDSSS